MRMLAIESALFPRLAPAPRALALECRPSGLESVIFVHGARTHVLGIANRSMVTELHRLASAHVVVCQDRPSDHRRAGTVRIRAWVSRDEGETWLPDRSFDVTAISRRTRIDRRES